MTRKETQVTGGRDVILAQLETNGSSILEAFERYGVSLVMLVMFILATIYILRRLLHDERGLLTSYIRSTNNQQTRLADTVTTMAETDAKVADVLGNMDGSISRIEAILQRTTTPGNRGDNTALVVCYRHECDVLEAISDKLEIDDKTKPLLDMMRRELDMAATRAAVEQNENG